MRFLNPAILWFLPLALLPLLLNFIFPLKPFKLPFSSVLLLRAARDSRLKKVTAAKTLILLLRCLVVLCLVGAFSKPVVGRRFLGALSGLTAGAGRPVSLVVLADRSLSMSAAFAGRSRLDFAAGAGAGILGALGGRDEAALVLFDSDAVGGDWNSDLIGVSKQLLSAAPGFKGTDYRKALEKAYALLALKSPARKKAVLLLSDSARSGFTSMPGAVSGLRGYDPAVTLTGLVFPAAPNAWVRGVTALEGGGGRARLAVFTGAAGGSSPRGLPLNLYAPVFSGAARTAPAGAGPSAVFDLPAGDDPSGRVELGAPDALARDNAVFFSLARKEPSARKALVLYEGPEALKPGGDAYFLKKFFETEAGAGGAFTADFMELSALERPPGTGYGTLIIHDGPGAVRQAAIIDAFVRSGGGAFIIAGASGKPSGALLSALGFTYGETLERSFSLAAPEAGGGFEGSDFGGFDLNRVKTARIVRLSAPPAFETLWNFREPSGAVYPALFGGRRGKGRVLVWTSSLSLPCTDLAAKPVFAPFMSACLRRLCGVKPPRLRQAVVGGVYTGSLENTDSVKVAVTAPDGTRNYVLARDGVFNYTLTDSPGLYSFSAPPESGTFAVDLDAENGESSLEPETFPPWTVLAGDDPVEEFKSAVYGVEIGQFLLLLALAAFLAEFLLSRRAL
jgi:hypothetical protein